MKNASTIIITMAMDLQSHQYFTDLRCQHYPKHLNYLEAHLTLFYRLPANNKTINKVLLQVTNISAFELSVASTSNTGNCIAFNIESDKLIALHREMQWSLNEFLINRDRENLQPHVTIQNKVTSQKALKTFEYLQSNFKPFNIKGTGLHVWHYLKGPWQLGKYYPFQIS